LQVDEFDGLPIYEDAGTGRLERPRRQVGGTDESDCRLCTAKQQTATDTAEKASKPNVMHAHSNHIRKREYYK
jgi:hypothetical protein